MEKVFFPKAKSSSASQKVSCILRKQKFHYRIHKSPTDLCSAHAPVPFLYDPFWYCPPTQVWFFRTVSLSQVPHQNSVHPSQLVHKCYMSRPSHLFVLDLPNDIGPSLRPRRSCRHMLIVYIEELLASRPPQLVHQTFLALRDFLFNIFAATLHMWRRYSSPLIWRRTVTW
jgi:hypothetical protein